MPGGWCGNWGFPRGPYFFETFVSKRDLKHHRLGWSSDPREIRGDRRGPVPRDAEEDHNPP